MDRAVIFPLAAAALLAAATLSAAPAVTFGARAVAVSGVTPKGQVVWFSVAREIAENAATLVRREDVLADTDGDGVVRFELDRDVPRQSLWVAVDLSTGAAAVAAPQGYPLRDLTATRPAIGSAGLGRPVWIESGRPYIELLFVRPGIGAWGLAVGDGGQNDDNPRPDGRLVATLARMHALSGSPAAPDKLAAKDLIFAIDPNRMEYFMEQMPDQP